MGSPNDFDIVVIPRHGTAHFSMYSMTNPGLDTVDLYAVDGMKHSGAFRVVHLARRHSRCRITPAAGVETNKCC